MNCVDIFVFLDDVQFQKNSWHNRNKVLVNQNAHWITVPIKKDSLQQLICNTHFNQNIKWQEKHIKLLKQSYAKHPHTSCLTGVLEIINRKDITDLATLNIEIILWITSQLGIKAKTIKSSQLKTEGKRTERLMSILKHLDADTYLSPVGSKEYLLEDKFESLFSIKLEFQKFIPSRYPQHKTKEFIPYLSVIDLVANVGWEESSKYLSR